MKMYFYSLVDEIFNTRYLYDQRKKVDKYIIDYIGEDGEHYRKSICVKLRQHIDIPQVTTHEQFAEFKKQIEKSI